MASGGVRSRPTRWGCRSGVRRHPRRRPDSHSLTYDRRFQSFPSECEGIWNYSTPSLLFTYRGSNARCLKCKTEIGEIIGWIRMLQSLMMHVPGLSNPGTRCTSYCRNYRNCPFFKLPMSLSQKAIDTFAVLVMRCQKHDEY